MKIGLILKEETIDLVKIEQIEGELLINEGNTEESEVTFMFDTNINSDCEYPCWTVKNGKKKKIASLSHTRLKTWFKMCNKSLSDIMFPEND